MSMTVCGFAMLGHGKKPVTGNAIVESRQIACTQTGPQIIIYRFILYDNVGEFFAKLSSVSAKTAG